MQFEVYNLNSNRFWSGFFTSDPYFKKKLNDFENYIYAYDQLRSLSKFEFNVSDFANHAHLTEALMQHHDAITGTHKEQVGKNYEGLMKESVRIMDESLAQIL